MYERTCEVCGKSYLPSGRRQRYHSGECRLAARRQARRARGDAHGTHHGILIDFGGRSLSRLTPADMTWARDNHFLATGKWTQLMESSGSLAGGVADNMNEQRTKDSPTGAMVTIDDVLSRSTPLWEVEPVDPNDPGMWRAVVHVDGHPVVLRYDRAYRPGAGWHDAFTFVWMPAVQPWATAREDITAWVNSPESAPVITAFMETVHVEAREAGYIITRPDLRWWNLADGPEPPTRPIPNGVFVPEHVADMMASPDTDPEDRAAMERVIRKLAAEGVLTVGREV